MQKYRCSTFDVNSALDMLVVSRCPVTVNEERPRTGAEPQLRAELHK
jgi:hypothetical protein